MAGSGRVDLDSSACYKPSVGCQLVEVAVSARDVRLVLDRHLAAEAAGDAVGAASTYAANGFYDNHALEVRFEGREGVELQYAAVYDTIRDMKATYLFEQVSEDHVMQCGRITGRAAESILGVPTAQGTLDFSFLAMIVFRDGQMLGEHILYDLEEFCAQAGADVQLVRAAADALSLALTGGGS